MPIDWSELGPQDKPKDADARLLEKLRAADEKERHNLETEWQEQGLIAEIKNLHHGEISGCQFFIEHVNSGFNPSKILRLLLKYGAPRIDDDPLGMMEAIIENLDCRPVRAKRIIAGALGWERVRSIRVKGKRYWVGGPKEIF